MSTDFRWHVRGLMRSQIALCKGRLGQSRGTNLERMTNKNKQKGDSSPRPARTPSTGDSSPRRPASAPSVGKQPVTTASAARPAGVAGQVRLQAGTSETVLAVIPHMLGFYPSRSLVVLGLGDRNRVMVTFRYDLPDPPDDEVAHDIAEHAQYVLSREGLSAALLVGYGPTDLVAPAVIATASRLAGAGVRLHEVLHADSGRYWSLTCQDETCCPPEGRRYDPGSHPAAATMADAGLPVYPDREALARTLQRPAGSADAVMRATSQAVARLSDLVGKATAEGDRDPKLLVARIGRREVQRAIRLYRSGGSITRIDQLAWLAVLLADLRVRDDAWARMVPAHHEHHRRLWTDVLRGAAKTYAAAPASLLAFTAWQEGNGALATMAVERALAADPAYSMAQLLAGAVAAALPPSAARMPMTPAAVAYSYGVNAAKSPPRPSRSDPNPRRSGATARSLRRSRSRDGVGGKPAGATGKSAGAVGKQGRADGKRGGRLRQRAPASPRERTSCDG